MRRRWAGIIGITVATVALAATVVAEHVMPKPPEPEPTVRSSVNVSIGRFNFGWRSKREPEQPPPPPAPEPLLSRDRVRLGGTVLGIAALPLAVLSWARRERAWWGFGICGFAIAAIAWQTFVIVFAVLLLSGAIFAFLPVERWVQR